MLKVPASCAVPAEAPASGATPFGKVPKSGAAWRIWWRTAATCKKCFATDALASATKIATFSASATVSGKEGKDPVLLSHFSPRMCTHVSENDCGCDYSGSGKSL